MKELSTIHATHFTTVQEEFTAPFMHSFQGQCVVSPVLLEQEKPERKDCLSAALIAFLVQMERSVTRQVNKLM